MDHAQVQEAFSDYWDKSLGAEARAQVEAHLQSCEACSKEYEGFQRAMAPLGQLQKPAATVDLRESVPALIRRRSQGRFFGPRSLLQRRALEWIALSSLGLIAVVYVLMKFLHPAVRVR